MPIAPALQMAFDRRADAAFSVDRPMVGVFGEGIPDIAIRARGARVLDVKAPPLADAVDGARAPEVDAVTEPFMDVFACRFLHRFATGAFDQFALIVFSRDDAAGLAAYQYARELRRQGRIPETGPTLHLWNLLHTQSAAAAAFNLSEFARLEACLSLVLGTNAGTAELEAAHAAEMARHAALAQLPPGGAQAFVARAAGRWLTPEAHVALLADLVLDSVSSSGRRIALVGTACDTPVMHELCAGLGTIVADLQEYAQSARPPANIDVPTFLEGLARDPLHIRAAPPGRLTEALHAGVDQADLVIATVAPNDDGFGWEIPGLRATVESRGGRFLDLGFRPFRPDGTWRDRARRRIEEVLA